MKVNKFIALAVIVMAFLIGMSTDSLWRSHNPCDNYPVVESNQQMLLRGQRFGNTKVEFIGLDPTNSTFSTGLLMGVRDDKGKLSHHQFHALPGVWIVDPEFELTFKLMSYCIARNSDLNANGVDRFEDWILIQYGDPSIMM